MATAEQYAEWIVANQSKKGTPEFDTVTAAYKQAKGFASGFSEPPAQQEPAPQKREITGLERLAANPITRFAMASGSPVLGLAEWLPGKAGQAVAENNRILKDMITQGESDLPDEAKWLGTAADIGGSALSPAFLKIAKMLPSAKTLLGLLGQGAAIGGLGGASAATGNADLESKLQTTGIGALAGGILTPVVAGGLRAATNMIAPSVSTKAADRGFAKTMTKASKTDAEDVARILTETPSGSTAETVAQQVAGLKRPEVSALQKVVETYDPKAWNQNLELQNVLRKFGVKKLNAETEPIRQGIGNKVDRLSQAMVTLPEKADAARQAAASSVDDLRRLERAGSIAQGYDIAGIPTLGSGQRPVIGTGLTQASWLVAQAEKGMTKAAEESIKQGATARVAENLIGSWQERGLQPLTSEAIASNIEGIKTASGNKSNDQLRLILTRISNAVKRASNPDGTVDFNELYTLRKTGINDTIDRIAGDNKSLAQRMSSGDIIDLKKSIDDAIENAGGKGWKQYLKDYGAARDKIEGPLRRLEEVADDKSGTKEVARLLNESYKWDTPNLLYRPMTVLNAAMRGFEGVAGENVLRSGSRLMRPEESKLLGELMQTYQANPYGLLGEVVRRQGGATQGLLSTKDTP